ncbi:recombinase family protein [Paenibacillus sp. sgz302251]|uniref:recombinase family protein n=1 Tax=Paenibacillus sp. sgz302251 TaxID=3414493 RepID=UPI003C7E01B0
MKQKIVAYIRISTNHTEQKHSLISQRHYFEHEVLKQKSEYSNCEMSEIYADEGLTATKFMRPSFLLMVHDAGVDIDYKDNRRKKGKMRFEASKDREPKFSRVLVTNISRMSRDVVIVDVLRELAKKNVYVDFIDNGWTTEKQADWTFITLFFTLAEQESRDRSEKVKSGLAKTASRGKLFSVHNLYGYDYIDKKLVINEAEAAHVRTVFNMYADGIGVRRISKYLADNNILTRKGENFSESTIRLMIANEKYEGILYRNKHDNGEVHMHKRTLKDKSEWINASDIEHADMIPAIITSELFERVQDIRNNKVSSTSKRGMNTGTSEYAGLLICAQCGSKMIKSTQYNKNKEALYHFYLCSNKKNNGKKACNMIRVHEDWIKQIFSEFDNEDINSMLNDNKDDWIIDLNKLKNKLESNINNQDKAEADRLQLLLADISEKKKRLAKLFIMGKFTDEELYEMKQEIDTEYAEIEEQYKHATLSNEDLLKSLKDIDDVISNVRNFSFKGTINNRELLQEVVIVYAVGKNSDILSFLFELTIFDKLYDIVRKYFNEDDRIFYSTKDYTMELLKTKS